MPADVVGTNLIVKDKEETKFKFEQGPIFANLVLADEINRATPKTQSALLEAMQEKTVTVGRTTYNLPNPFMVLATQNPIEMEGTYPLPEAQMDRFLFKLKVDFPSLNELKDIMDITVTNNNVDLKGILTGEDILAMRSIVREVPMAEAVKEYALKLILATHPESEYSNDFVKKYVEVGASPRGAQGLFNGSKVEAILKGRLNVAFEDINDIAYAVLRHRIFLNFEAVSEGITTDMVIKEVIKSLKVI